MPPTGMPEMKVDKLLWVGCLFCAAVFGQAGPNLVPNPDFHLDSRGKPASWVFWSPRHDLEPRTSVASDPGGVALKLTAVDFSSFGKWMAKDIAVKPGHFYRFDVLYKTTSILNERGSVGVMLSWNMPDGQPVQRDYVDRISPADPGWHRAERILRVPAKASNVTIELWLRWTADGSVSFRKPELVETKEPPSRKVKVVTTRIPIRWN